MGHNYFYGEQADQFSSIRIPKALMTEEIFAPLSMQAKILYGLMLDKMGLSIKNEWMDKENRPYIIYTIQEIQEAMSISKKKACDILSELVEIGLVEKKRQGLGLPSMIYVKKFQRGDV